MEYSRWARASKIFVQVFECVVRLGDGIRKKIPGLKVIEKNEVTNKLFGLVFNLTEKFWVFSDSGFHSNEAYFLEDFKWCHLKRVIHTETTNSSAPGSIQTKAQIFLGSVPQKIIYNFFALIHLIISKHFFIYIIIFQ